VLKITGDFFAGVPVRSLAGSRAWFGRLLGCEPSFLPNDSEAVWELAEHRFLYAKQDPARAGNALILVFVEDLDAVVADIASRGLEPADQETYPNAVRKVIYRDADGNEVAFGGAPKDSTTSR
jgi:hypothetical protein